MSYIGKDDYAEKWMMVKETVVPILISQKTAIKFQNIVVRPYFDLEVIYAVPVISSVRPRKRACTIQDLSEWGVDEETLYKQALLNLKANAKDYQYESVETLIEELIGIQYLIESEEGIALSKIPLYVLTNREKVFGSAILLNLEYLQQLSEGRSYFIIPSSIHEVLILWDDGKVTQDELNLIIQDINFKLPPDERLASHSFYYDARTNELRTWQQKQSASEKTAVSFKINLLGE